MWTTICRRGWNECQILSPRDWDMVIRCEDAGDLAEMADLIRNSKYFEDK